MRIPKELEGIVTVNPNMVGGEPCLAGTRMPLRTVLDNLAGGHSVEELLDEFPGLERPHIEAVLRGQADTAPKVADDGILDPKLDPLEYKSAVRREWD